MQTLIMVCLCGEYSADYADYSFWGRNPDKVFECEECGCECELVERATRTELGPATITRMGEYARDPQRFKREYLESQTALLRDF